MYQDSYTHPVTLASTKIMTDDWCTLGADDGTLEGEQAHGVIQDEESGYNSSEIFSSSWLEKNPTRRMLLAQSAAIVVAKRPDVTMSAKVL